VLFCYGWLRPGCGRLGRRLLYRQTCRFILFALVKALLPSRVGVCQAFTAWTAERQLKQFRVSHLRANLLLMLLQVLGTLPLHCLPQHLLAAEFHLHATLLILLLMLQ
jgi:hypothetical protein